MPQTVRTFGNCFHRMVRSVVDSPGTASQILLEEMVVDDQTGVVTEIWSSMNCLVVRVAGHPCELNSLDKEPAQKPHLALEIVLCS